jgi:5-methylcytosine-specific restriction protein B
VAAAARGEDVTGLVFLKLFPYADTTPNREKGAWVHVAPAVNADLQGWFEGSGLVQRGDWPAVATHVLEFLR